MHLLLLLQQLPLDVDLQLLDGLGRQRCGHVAEDQVDVLAVVEAGGPLLLFWGDPVQAFLHEVAQVLLLQRSSSALKQALLQVALDDRPKCLNGVQFWRIGRQEHELDVQPVGQLPDTVRVVGPVVVSYRHNPVSWMVPTREGRE